MTFCPTTATGWKIRPSTCPAIAGSKPKRCAGARAGAGRRRLRGRLRISRRPDVQPRTHRAGKSDGCRCPWRGHRQLCRGRKAAAARWQGRRLHRARHDHRRTVSTSAPAPCWWRRVPGPTCSWNRRPAEAAAHRLIRSKGIHLLVPQISQRGAHHRGRQRPSLRPALARPHLAGHHRHGIHRRSRHGGGERKRHRRLPRHLPQISARRAGLDARQVEFFYAGSAAAGQRWLQRTVTMSAAAPNWWIMARKAAWTACSRRWAANGPPRAAWRKTSPMRWWRGWERKPRPAPPPTTPLPGGRFDRFEDMVKGLRKPGRAFRPCATWRTCWGRGCPQALKGARLADLVPLGPSGDTPAQIAFAHGPGNGPDPGRHGDAAHVDSASSADPHPAALETVAGP